MWAADQAIEPLADIDATAPSTFPNLSIFHSGGPAAGTLGAWTDGGELCVFMAAPAFIPDASDDLAGNVPFFAHQGVCAGDRDRSPHGRSSHQLPWRAVRTSWCQNQ